MVMGVFRRAVLLIGVLLGAFLFPWAAQAQPLPGDVPPPGFELLNASIGVAVYRHEDQNGNVDFVQIVNLAHGAAIELMHGEILNQGVGDGVYGGDSPQMMRYLLQQYWSEFSFYNETAFCVTNGQFFLTHEDPTPLTLPLKKNDHLLGEGYGSDKYFDEQLMFELWDDHADIISLTQESLYLSSAPHIIGGFTDYIGTQTDTVTGRTFIGLDDAGADGLYEIVLIFNSRTATQSRASAVLRSFGADKVMMLDGGGSTQLICLDKVYVASEREIPQALAVRSGGLFLPDYRADVVDQTYFLSLMPEEISRVYVELENSGHRAWIFGQGIRLVRAQGASLGSITSIDLPRNVLPGESARWEFTVVAPLQPQLYQSTWRLTRGDIFIGDPITISLVVMSPDFVPTPDLAGAQVDLNRSPVNWTKALWGPVMGGLGVLALVFGAYVWVLRRRDFE